MYKAWLYLSWRGDTQQAVKTLQAGVRRMGFERAFTAGFLASLQWVSRILAQDPWYRSMLGRVALGPPDLDSVDYYMHKAALFEGLGQRETALAYYDSVVPVLRTRLQANVQPAAQVVLRAYLGIAYGTLGRKKDALDQARQCIALSPPGQGAHLSAWIYASTGDGALAAEEFAQALSSPNYITPRLLAVDPGLQALRQVPRFREILASHQ